MFNFENSKKTTVPFEERLGHWNGAMSPMSLWIADARLVVKILLGRLQIQKLQIDTSHTSHTPHTSHSTSYTELDSLDTVVLDKVFVGFRWILWVTTTETLSHLCANQTWLNTHPTFKNRHGALGCVTHVTHVWWTDGPKVELQTQSWLSSYRADCSLAIFG